MLLTREYTAMLVTLLNMAKEVRKVLLTSMMMDDKVGGVSAKFLVV